MGLRKTAEVAGVLVFLVAIASNTTLSAISSFFQGSFICSMFYGLVSTALAIAIVICIDMIRLNPADSHTVYSLLYQYYIEGKWYIEALLIRQKLFGGAKDMKKQQEGVLRDIMNANKDSAYGKSLKLSEVTNADDFRQKVPFSSYSDIDPYIDRTLKGEENMVTTNKILFMCFTAGTTGKNKRFVGPKQMPVKEFVSHIYYSVVSRLGRTLGRPIMLFHNANYIHTPNGIPVLPLSVAAYNYEKHYLQPLCVYNITDEQPFLYTTAIFSMRDKEVTGIRAVFSSMMYSFWNLIDANWEKICDDIERGEISKSVQVSDERRQEINSFLTPDPERAAFLRRQFGKGMKGIAKRVWPRMYYADMICSGSLAQCTKLMLEKEMLGIPILSCFFSASECMGGLNTSDEVDDTTYTLYSIPYFFEWIPEDNASDANPDTLLTHQLEVDKKYEVVVTSHAGLTRYRLGDVFHIVRKIDQLPVFQFSHRTGQMLDMVGEKVTEVHFATQISSFFEKKGLELIDYTACESIYFKDFENYEEIFKDPVHKPQCYHIFVDVKEPGPRNDFVLPASTGKEFDEHFCQNTELYNWLRGAKALGQMKLVHVEAKAFAEMKEIIIGETQTQQYKVPRAMRKPDVLKLLLSRIMEPKS